MFLTILVYFFFVNTRLVWDGIASKYQSNWGELVSPHVSYFLSSFVGKKNTSVKEN